MKLSDILIKTLEEAGKFFIWSKGEGEGPSEIVFARNLPDESGVSWSTTPNIDINNTTETFSVGDKVWDAKTPGSIQDFVNAVLISFP